MLEPDELPDELQHLERELSQLPNVDLSAELQSRVMLGVRTTKRRGDVLRKARRKTIVAISGLATVAVVLLIMLRLQNTDSDSNQSGERELMMSTEDPIEPMLLPTVQAYRLSFDASPDDWETWIESRADTFVLEHNNSTSVFAWNDQTSLLESGE